PHWPKAGRAGLKFRRPRKSASSEEKCMTAKGAFISSIFLAAGAIGPGCAPHGEPPHPAQSSGIKIDANPAPVPVPSSLKERIDAALKNVHSRDLLTTHAFWTVFHGILGMGLEQTKLVDPLTEQRFNAIDYVCNGGKIRGMKFMPMKDGGLDVQTQPG